MINCNLFDKKLSELNERIGKTQCRSKHEAIANELFVSISLYFLPLIYVECGYVLYVM